MALVVVGGLELFGAERQEARIGAVANLGGEPRRGERGLVDPQLVEPALERLLGAAPGVTATALAAPTTGALVAGQAAELRVFGHPLVFLRVTAVANSASTTNMKVLVRGGAPRAKTRRV